MLKAKVVPRKEYILATLSYALCSCSMLLVNKLVMHYLHYPSIVSSIQFLAAILCVCLMKLCGRPIDNLEWSKLKPYAIYCISFAVGCYSNMKVLSSSNVETVIVFRASTPLAVALCDYFFLQRNLPNRRSLFSLTSILGGAIGYVLTDSQFILNGPGVYSWALVYYVSLVFSMVYGKKLISSVKLNDKVWGSVLYTQLLSIPILMTFAFINDELVTFPHALLNIERAGLIFLVISCVVGVGISYCGWWARDVTSATTYTLIGVLNKLGTVTVNALIWDKHASWKGISALVICLIGGSFYQPAPAKFNKYIPTTTKGSDDVTDENEVEEKEVCDGSTVRRLQSRTSP